MKYETIKHHPDYKISDTGVIINTTTGTTMKASLTPLRKRHTGGYMRIELKNPRKKYLVHRLVAEAFLPNFDNLPYINHKDEDKTNNDLSNLEWCTNRYNSIYSRGKKVRQYDLKGNFIKEFNCLNEAVGFDYRLISAVCLNKRKTHGGYIWKYATD